MRRALKPLLCAVALLSVPAFAQDDDAPTPPPPVAPTGPAKAVRPEGTTLGLGAGWVFPQSILEPNTVGVRLRLSTLAIEPSVRVGGSGGTNGNKSVVTFPGQPDNETTNVDKDSGMTVSAGATVRIPLMSRGPVDLIAIGGASVAMGNSTVNNDVTNTNRTDTVYTNTFSASVGYGLGIEWFLGHGLSLCADATNPLLTWTESNSRRTIQTTNTGTMTTSTVVSNTNRSDLTGALVWAPNLRLTLFLYF